MSLSPQTPETTRSKYEAIFDEALEVYEKKTGNVLRSDPLLRALEACESPDETLSELQRQVPGFDRSENSDNKLTNWVNPVVNVLYIFSQTIGSGVSLAFKPGAVIFTAISSLLSVVMAVRAVQVAISDLFERIKWFFIRLKIYDKLQPTEEVTEIIVDVMVHVLHVLTLLTKEIKQGIIKRFLKKLVGRSDIEDASRRFGKLTEEESRMMTVQNARATHGVSEGVSGLRNNVQSVVAGVEDASNKLDRILHGSNKFTGNRQRKDLVKWLSPLDLSTNFKSATDVHHERTGEWLTQGSVFRSWKQSGSLLWINGKPGSGKTVLSSTIIQDVNKTTPGRYGFFFFDFKDADKSNARSLLSSLIVQLSDQSDDLFDVFIGLNSSYPNKSQPPSVDALTQCLEDMFRVAHEVPIYLIIDALDECPFTDEQSSPRRQVLDLVEKYIKLDLPNLRICVTSRPGPDIKAALEPLTSISNIISLHDESGQKNDIVNFVRSEVHFHANLQRWREEDRELAIKTLSDKADGTFRWVTCQLEILRPCLPPSVRRTIDNLPGNLDATYERILKEIPLVNRVYAHRLLQCLVVAIRPLVVDELAEVLAIDFDGEGGIPELIEGFRWEDQEQAVLSACSNLVVVVNYPDSRPRVQFSHFSVHEFLTSHRISNSESSALSYYYIQPKSAHTVMAQACLGALLRLGDEMDKETIESYPLADYAGDFFVSHAKAGDMLLKPNNGVDKLLDPDKPHFNTWLWLQSFDWDSQYFHLNPDSSSDSSEQYSEQPNSEYPIYPPRVSPLYYTLLFGHTCLAQYLIRNRPRDLCVTDKYGRTALHIAAFKSDFDVVQMLIDTVHIAVDCRDNKKCTPLHYAVHDGDQDSHEDVSRCVELLIESGAVIEAQNNRGSTPLHLAASKMSEKTVQLMISKVADINLGDNKSQTALHKASGRGHLDIVRLLLDHKAGIDLQDNHGSTPLHLAIYYMNLETVRLLLDRGADVTLRTGKGHTVLHQALQRGYPDITQLILKGANADALDNDGSTPLHLAAFEAEGPSSAQQLLGHGAKIDLQNKKGQAALHLASQRGHLDFMKLLLNRDAVVDVPDNDGFTPLHLAIFKPDRRAAELLLKHGANINLRNDKGQTALHRASERGDLLFMEVALACGADVNARNIDGLTPLDLVIFKFEEPAAQLLAKHGAILTSHPQNEKGQTLLHNASQTGHIDLMRFLLKCGAEMNALDNDGSTPLHLAISGQHQDFFMMDFPEVVANVDARDKNGSALPSPATSVLTLPAAKPLLQLGANTDPRNNEHQTGSLEHLEYDDFDFGYPLMSFANMYARDENRSVLSFPSPKTPVPTLPAAKLLLQHGANTELQNNKRQTALQLALQYDRLDFMKLLLENGANVDARDKNGSTLLHLAISGWKLPAAELFLRHGANIELRDNKRQTAVHLTLSHGDHHMVHITRHLLNHCVDLDALDDYGSTPLILAISNSRLEDATLLLNRGANIGQRNHKSQTLLHLASQRGDLNIIHLLLQCGANADMNAPDDDGSTPLGLAISNSKLEAAKLLLNRGANIGHRNHKSQTLLHLASQRGGLDIITFLIEHGSNTDMDALDDDGSTLLHIAVFHSQLKAAELWLDLGLNIDLCDKKGRTALHLASQRDNFNIMRLLLDNGANADAQDSVGLTPLHLVISNGREVEQTVGLLLERGANINLQNGQGQTALHKAALRGKPKIMGVVLDHGADVDAQDNDGLTPLHLMISKVSTKASKGSDASEGPDVSKGSDAPDDPDSSEGSDAPDDSDSSEGSDESRDSGASTGSESLRDAIKLLLKHGASGQRKNNQGETPFQVATARGLEEITGMLSMHIPSEQTT